jgi:hypothetical protein
VANEALVQEVGELVFEALKFERGELSEWSPWGKFGI